jgi:sugar/nucleoside kinase (ribokinase family)
MIVVVGDIAVDIVSRLRAPLARGSDAAARVQVMPGGSGANVAVWLARLGQEVTFIGRIGDDMFGRWLAQDLAAEGVRPALVVDGERATGVIQVLVEPDGERTMVPDRGANARWTPEDVPEALIARADLLHVVGYILLDRDSQPGALQAMRYARDHGVPISLDPSSHAPLLALGVKSFWELVGRPTVLLPNRAEAQALTGETDPERALEALREHAAVVVIKLDRAGCLAGAGRERCRMPAPPAVVVNATGAGDAFNAAFLARWLANGAIEAACRAGVALGTHAATLPTTR